MSRNPKWDCHGKHKSVVRGTARQQQSTIKHKRQREVVLSDGRKYLDLYYMGRCGDCNLGYFFWSSELEEGQIEIVESLNDGYEMKQWKCYHRTIRYRVGADHEQMFDCNQCGEDLLPEEAQAAMDRMREEFEAQESRLDQEGRWSISGRKLTP